ncbi:N-acetylglucosaminyl transferase component-domain-containing protein [Multifurca ochricompacta]|uniref:N-acetylglucosaminyl transferase component-domain-containing protein n=1 Tax=Multifurca ochricompacta TaxID=376703 RepID=A0AAD4M6H8_9AGAM|nr:N-acetylglucosaminyl transferase component-domain-containing protein [Multifurca ochricompacta]
MIANYSIFWPIEDEGKVGYCYGWVNSRLVCVAGVLQVGSLERANTLLNDFLSENPRFTEVSTTDAPKILGECSSRSPSYRTPSIQFLPGVEPASSAHVSIGLHAGRTGTSLLCAFVMYRRSALGSVRFHTPEDATSRRSIAIPDSHPTFETVGFNETALTQLNATYRLHSLLNLSGSWLARFRLLDMAAHHIHDACARPERACPHLFSGLKSLLDLTMGFFRQYSPWIAPVREYSKLLDQLSARSSLVQDLVSYPRLSYVYGKLETSAEYVRFNNAVWLVMNDVILGTVVGAFVCENSGVIGTSLHDWLKAVFIDFTRDALLWLDDWPEGLKLNTELSSFLVHTLLGVLELWAYILRLLSPHFPTIAHAVGLSGYGGLTVPMSLFLDIFNALTLHISLSHLILKKALLYQTSALRSLWNLFRGKRFNVLHRRTDSWHYDVDQLILGTLLFTLFTFSLPTLLTYALLFTLMKSGVVITCIILSLAIDLMNHFPLFALLLRMKDPRRLPGSIYFRVISDNGNPMLMLEVRVKVFSLRCKKIPRAVLDNTDTNYTHFNRFDSVRVFALAP